MKQYIIGLNGLRAIAVFFVIISHRFPEDHIFRSLPLGDYGVNFFFVLSGYLISRGLFFQLKSYDNNFNLNVKILKNFFIKRFLRIFPVYYLLLLFLYLTDGIIGNHFKENILWYVLYAANFLIYTQDKWFGALAHLWSLSVEEQYYIFFPLVIVFLFRNKILMLLISLIIVGTIYPFLIDGKSNILTISCVNSFSVGGLLAYIEINKNSFLAPFYKYILYLSILMGVIIICNNYYFTIPFFSERLAISIIAVYLITLCLLKENSFVVKKILNNNFLNFVGIISYGVYLYHNIVPKYLNFILLKMNIKQYSFSYSLFLLQTSLIIIISYLSWIIFEKPILKLKKHLIN